VYPEWVQEEAILKSSMTFSQRFGFHTDAHGAAAGGRRPAAFTF
jgi:hypothetical protein